MKTQIKLTNPTDDELSAAVAEHVAGWKYLVGTIGGHLGIPPPPNRGIAEKVTSYATSADAVLPLLERAKERGLWVQIKDHTNGIDCGRRDWLVIISNYDDCCDPDPGDPGYPDYKQIRYFEGAAPVLARAISVALCKEAGIEVEYTPPNPLAQVAELR